MGITTSASTGSTAFMAECFWPGVTECQVAGAGQRAWRAAEAMSRGGSAARYLGSILVPADEIALCLFAAASLEQAQEMNRRAAIPAERVIEVVHIGCRYPSAGRDVASKQQRGSCS